MPRRRRTELELPVLVEPRAARVSVTGSGPKSWSMVCAWAPAARRSGWPPRWRDPGPGTRSRRARRAGRRRACRPGSRPGSRPGRARWPAGPWPWPNAGCSGSMPRARIRSSNCARSSGVMFAMRSWKALRRASGSVLWPPSPWPPRPPPRPPPAPGVVACVPRDSRRPSGCRAGWRPRAPWAGVAAGRRRCRGLTRRRVRWSRRAPAATAGGTPPRAPPPSAAGPPAPPGRRRAASRAAPAGSARRRCRWSDGTGGRRSARAARRSAARSRW